MGEGAQEHSTQEESHYEWPMKDKRILFVVSQLTGGGAQRRASILASELAIQGYAVGMLIEKASFDEFPLSGAVQVLRIPSLAPRSKNPVREIPRQMRKMYSRIRLMRKFAPDILIPFLPGVTEAAYIANKFIHAKYVLPICAYPKNGANKRWSFPQIANRYIIRHCDALYLKDKDQAACFSNMQRRKAFISPNPINNDLVADSPHRTDQIQNIVHVGRLADIKDQKLLIRSFSKVLERFPNAHLNIYGEGKQKKSLEKLIGVLNLTGKAELLGWTSNVMLAYQQSDLFVLCSKSEAMPNVLLEAMASGLPVISTDCPTGPSEIISDYQTGLLVPVGNEEALTHAILSLMENPSLANRLAENGWKSACDQYRVDKVVFSLVNGLSKTLYSK